jgi:hypothetical protein
MSYISKGPQPTKITGEQWGRKVSIELPNSDTDIHELLDIFKGITIGLGYTESGWDNGIKEMAESIYETENTNLKDSLSEWTDDELGEAIAEFNHLESLDD